jgi:hypothetical protein
MTNGKTLPPLPASDEKSVSSNSFNPYYKIKAREFWGENEVISESPEPFKKCKHLFIPKAGGAQCKTCGFGLIGFIEVQKEKLYHQGKAIGL